MEKNGWKKAVLSILIAVASFFYTGVAQGGLGPPPTFSKSFAPDPINAGGTSTLTFTIDNTGVGGQNTTALDFTDNLPAGVVVASPNGATKTCTGGMVSAAPGGTTIAYSDGSVLHGASCTVSVNVTSSTVGMHVNTTGDLTSLPTEGSSGTASDTLTVNAAADLAVTKTDGVTSAVPGQSLTYTIVVSNAGPSTDPAVALTDTFPADLTCTFTSVAAGGATGNTAMGAGNLAETLSMPTGSSVTYTVSCTIDADATGTLSNTATITPSITDTVPGNNSATDNDTVLTPQADLAVTKTDGVTSAVPGQTTLIYTIVATNNGPSTDPAVALTDTFPADLTCTFTSVAAGGASGNTAMGSGNLAETLSMPAGSSVTYTVTCTIAASATGTLSNTATVTSSVTDPATSNNSATDSDTVLAPSADVAVTKTDGVTSATPGQSLTYTIVASNNGPSNAPSVTLTDTFPADLTCTFTSVAAGGATGNTAAGSGNLAETLSMPAGSSMTYTVTCTIAASATGTLSNTATVTSSVTDPNTANNTATDGDTVLASTTTTVADQTAIFSDAAQDVTLTATVTGSVVNEGTVSFQVKDGTINIGTAVTSATVSNSMASVTYSLPGGTVPKAYTIQASYSGGPNFGASTGTGTLTVTLLAPNSITVTKEASVEGPATFFFTTSGTGLVDFSLVDDGSGTNIQTFSNLSPGTFIITEIVPARWKLDTLVCASSGTGTSAVADKDTGQATITLAAGGSVGCTVANVLRIPTLPQWGMILFTLSLLTLATWQLAGRPVLVEAGVSGTVALLPARRQWLTSLLLGQGIATLGLGLYALLLGPLVLHDGVGAFLSGLLIGVMVEGYRRSWSR